MHRLLTDILNMTHCGPDESLLLHSNFSQSILTADATRPDVAAGVNVVLLPVDQNGHDVEDGPAAGLSAV